MCDISIALQSCDTAASVNIDGTYEETVGQATIQYRLKRESGNKVSGGVWMKATGKDFVKTIEFTDAELKDKSGMIILDYTYKVLGTSSGVKVTGKESVKVLDNGAKLEDQKGNIYKKK